MHSPMYWLHRLLWALSHKDRTAGIPIAVLLPEQEEKQLDVPKIVAALRVLQIADPRRYRRLLNDVSGIVLLGTRHFAAGEWYAPLKHIHLANDWVRDQATSPEAIASTLVHEATHARLTRFGYAETLRGRLERICYYQQTLFAARLQGGDQLVAQARAGMNRDPSFYSTSQRNQVRARALKSLGTPAFLVRLLERFWRWRAA